ncbi:unnamed protein product [Closterium sp. NIES-53]
MPGGAESEGAESGGAEPRGAALSGGPAGSSPSLSPRPETLSQQQLREWLVRCARLRSGATGARGAGVTAGVGGTGGAAAAAPGGARTRGTGAVGTGGVGGARAGGAGTVGAGAGGAGAGGAGAGGVGAVDPGAGGAGGTTEPRAAGARGAGAVGAGAGGTGAGGARAGGAGAVGAGAGGTGTGGARSGGAGAVDPGAGGAGGTVRPRPYFVPLLQQVLGDPSSIGLPPPLLCPLPNQSQPPFQPASSLPAPSPYTEQSGGLTECREPTSRPFSPVHTARRVPCSRPPPVPGTHAMALRPSSVPLRVPLPPPPESSLPESTAASALIAELLDFAVACRLALVAEFESASPPSVGGDCALGTDVLEDRQEEFEFLAAAVPHFASILLALEGDPDAPDIPTPLTQRRLRVLTPLSGRQPWMSRWHPGSPQAPTVKRPPGSPPAFKARYVARGFSQRQGVDYFQTFSPTPKMTTLQVLLHVAAQRDYELHSLDFSTTFLQGSLHEEIWLRRPPGFTGSFLIGTQWSLRRPVYGLRQTPHEWHDTLRTTLASLGFAPSIADPSLVLRTDTSLPPFYVLVYIDNLVFATADTEALTLVKSELQKRHTCTDLAPAAPCPPAPPPSPPPTPAGLRPAPAALQPAPAAPQPAAPVGPQPSASAAPQPPTPAALRCAAAAAFRSAAAAALRSASPAALRSAAPVALCSAAAAALRSAAAAALRSAAAAALCSAAAAALRSATAAALRSAASAVLRSTAAAALCSAAPAALRSAAAAAPSPPAAAGPSPGPPAARPPAGPAGPPLAAPAACLSPPSSGASAPAAVQDVARPGRLRCRPSRHSAALPSQIGRFCGCHAVVASAYGALPKLPSLPLMPPLELPPPRRPHPCHLSLSPPLC